MGWAVGGSVTDLVVDSGGGLRCGNWEAVWGYECSAGGVVDRVQFIHDGVDEAALKLVRNSGSRGMFRKKLVPFVGI